MMKYVALAVGIFLFSCQTQGNNSNNPKTVAQEVDWQELDTATFAGGCFWCVEASFEQIQGVAEAVSGYAGGVASNAKYQLVSSGRTNHAEAVQVYYDPSVISYETLLEIFFTAHDPTQLNRQGPDVGRQYRSEIFYHNEEQKKRAEAKMEELAADFSDPIVTRLSKLDGFYKAEDYHQDYEVNHPDNPYIRNVSRPKIEKVARKFKDILKSN
ncbi:MAG: peptide-methionine (S)-S-oxide reductase MsrA [Ekhidna sp.]|uniref:peptide-methionine (S)-S-oxide reductase MsrA n=1 Tax=Ekhidna sp. TaxID=2608089 RepID=UPI0032ED4D0E